MSCWRFARFRDLITRMVSLAKDAMKSLANFAPLSWPGLTRPSRARASSVAPSSASVTLDGRVKRGHDGGIGGDIRVIKVRDDSLTGECKGRQAFTKMAGTGPATKIYFGVR
jgi:hypothetical protein